MVGSTMIVKEFEDDDTIKEVELELGGKTFVVRATDPDFFWRISVKGPGPQPDALKNQSFTTFRMAEIEIQKYVEKESRKGSVNRNYRKKLGITDDEEDVS